MKTKTKSIIAIKVVTEEELIHQGIDKSGEEAYRTALRKGVAVTVLQGKKLLRINPDGSKSVIRKLSMTNKKVSALRFRVK
jgi:hypothetical protein